MSSVAYFGIENISTFLWLAWTYQPINDSCLWSNKILWEQILQNAIIGWMLQNAEAAIFVGIT